MIAKFFNSLYITLFKFTLQCMWVSNPILWFQGVISCRIKPKVFFFSVFLVELLYFTGFLKVYVTILLLKKYLTSKIEKNVPHVFFYLQFYDPLILEKKISKPGMSYEVYLICINFWKFHDHLKPCLEVIRLPTWPENVKFSTKMKFFTFLTPWKIRKLFQTFKGTLKMFQITFCPQIQHEKILKWP